MVIFVLQVLFALTYSVWIYQYFGVADIVGKITDINKLKHFIFNGHCLLFIFLFMLLYFVFFKLLPLIIQVLEELALLVIKVAGVILLNILIFVLAIIFWYKTKTFRYRPFWKISDKNEKNPYSFSLKRLGRFYKWVYLKAGILRSPEQKIRSSKEAARMLKEMRKQMIDSAEKVFDRIQTRFIFGMLLYVLYFYSLKADYNFPSFVNDLIFGFCIINSLVQFLAYCFYKNFRISYYFLLIGHRDIHRRDISGSDLLTMIDDAIQADPEDAIVEEN